MHVILVQGCETIAKLNAKSLYTKLYSSVSLNSKYTFFIFAIVPTNDFIRSLGTKKYLKLYIRQNKTMHEYDAMSQRQIMTDFKALNSISFYA